MVMRSILMEQRSAILNDMALRYGDCFRKREVIQGEVEFASADVKVPNYMSNVKRKLTRVEKGLHQPK
jgi:hypothetical protein